MEGKRFIHWMCNGGCHQVQHMGTVEAWPWKRKSTVVRLDVEQLIIKKRAISQTADIKDYSPTGGFYMLPRILVPEEGSSIVA